MNNCNQCFTDIKSTDIHDIHKCDACGRSYILASIDDLNLEKPLQFWDVGALPWYNSEGKGYFANGTRHPIDEFVEIDNKIYAVIPVQFYSDKKVFHATNVYSAFLIIRNGLKTGCDVGNRSHSATDEELKYKYVGLEINPAAAHKKEDVPSVILEGKFTGWVIRGRKIFRPGNEIYQNYLNIHPDVGSLQYSEPGNAMISESSVSIDFSEDENREILFKEICQMPIKEIFWFRRRIGIKAVLRLIYRSIRSSF